MAVRVESAPQVQVSVAAGTVARILLGLVFTLAGASVMFIVLNPPPAPPGLAGTFQQAFFQSHWVVFVDLTEFVAGVLLLANRYVAFALILLAALLSNIIFFHVSMMPQGLPIPLILAVLWIVVANQYRSRFAPLFTK